MSMESFDSIGEQSIEDIREKALDVMEADAFADHESRGYKPHNAAFIRAIDILTQ